MASAYISYSRKDREVTKRIVDALTNEELDVWIDWEDIPPTVDWMAEIEKGIEESNVFIFILSPGSVKSEVCLNDLDIAVKNNKRIIPIAVLDPDDGFLPETIARINWIFARENDDFDTAMQTLVKAIRTDYEWIRAQTQLQVKALEWERGGRDNGYLLRGKPLQDAENQLTKNSSKDPKPTELMREYVSASRENKSILSRGVEFVSNAIGGDRVEQTETSSNIGNISISPAQSSIFISYSRANDQFALKLATELKSSGLSVWLDQLDMPSGVRWEDELEKVLRDSNIFIVILSSASIKSQNVLDEIGYALDSGKTIFPVLLEQVEIPFQLRGLQFIDLTNESYDVGIQNIFRLLTSLEYRSNLPITPTQKSEEEVNDYEQSSDEIPELTPEQIAEREVRLQAAIEANRLANNRAQAVFNDGAQGEDQLGIKDEVDALAETLLLRDVEPPVAVGVMGGWGSGKSFVMYLINQYVKATRAKQVKKGWAVEDKEDPKIPSFVGHIYQVNFNAWTYAKSNLWASLMDTIFTTLNRQMQLERLLAYRNFSPNDEPPTKDQIRDSMLAGGEEFKKIYLENIQLDQDKDLKQWRENLVHWSQHLLKETLLWNVMRGQQVETLEKLKDTEEQLNQLKSRREQFEKDRSLKGITSEKLDAETALPAYVQSLKSFMLAFLSEQLTNTAKEELKKKDINEEEVQKYFKEATGLWGAAKTLFTSFRQSKLYLFWTIIFLTLTFTVPYFWDTYALEFVQIRVAKILSTLIALAPTLAAILSWTKKSIDAGVEAKKILEGAYTAQQAKHAEEIANTTETPLLNKISKLQTEISNGSVAAYDALISLLEAQAEEQRQKIGPSAKYSNLMEFVQSRLDAATYETQLGLMHQVRQDIDELTFSLVDNANEDAFPRGKPRVILYIDDLDRCPPPRVVEILEAVQLLLNTKLFIVILGLDTRYVTRSLEKEYKEILQHEGDPSGLDYIEKIIQIPYRVRSIEPDGLRNYIEKQMDIEQLPEPPKAEAATALSDEVQTPPPTTDQPAPAQTDIEQPSTEDEVPAPVDESIQTPTDITSDDSPTEPSQPSVELTEPEPETIPEPEQLEIELPAAVIQFKQEDMDDLTACCQKIVLTPRSIKRLVNVFKLMKIFWFRADKNAGLAERDRPRPVKQAAICLLAISSAYPEVMREVFVQLETKYRQGQVDIDLFTALNNITLPRGSAHELSSQYTKYKNDLVALKSITGNGQDKFGQLTLKEMMLSTFNIVRSFSFVGDPVYWVDDEEESAPLMDETKTTTPSIRKTTKKKDIK